MSYFKIKDWVCVRRSPSVNIFQNQLTAQLSEEYLFEVSSEEVLENFLSLSFLNHPQITKLLSFQKFTVYDPHCYSFSHFNVRLFSQFIEVRLGQILNIPHHYLYPLIHETLLGFQVIYQNLRPIKATPANIGFNKRNELKVVIHQDLTRDQQPNTISEEEIVQSIFGAFRGFFSANMMVPPSMNFTEAIYFTGYRISGQKTNFPINQLPKHDEKFTPNQSRVRIPRQSLDTKCMQTQMQFMSRHTPLIPRDGHIESRLIPERTNQRGQIHIVPGTVRSSTVQISVEEVRTTQNNLSVIGDVVELDRNQLPLELLDQKKPEYVKLSIIERILGDGGADEQLKGICRVYKHSITQDPLLYSQLKKTRGKIEEIKSEIIRKKIDQLMYSKQKYEGLTTRAPNLVFPVNRYSSEIKTQRQERIKRIIQNQKLKMQVQASKPNAPVNSSLEPQAQSQELSPIAKKGLRIQKLNQFKEEASRVLFDF